MTKYVVPVADPPPGDDWRLTVPGIYIYDVVGITATLATHTPGPAEQALFHTATNSGTGSVLEAWVQPASATENQLQLASEVGLPGLSDPFPSVNDGAPHMFAWVWDGGAAHYYVDGVPIGVAQPTSPSTSPSAMTLTILGGAGPASNVIDELSAHRSALSAGDIAALYAVAATGIANYGPAVLGFTPETYYHFAGPSTTMAVDASGNGNDGTYQISGGGAPEYVPGLVSGNDALRWTGTNPADDTRVLPAPLGIDWRTPFTLILWSMTDDGASSTGRQPTLLVTNGTDVVLAIPTGFAAVGTPGPYGYAWQPGLNADTQTTDGTLTTIAIPRLIMPPGYTVGTQTLDLATGDQWSNVALWWDDTYSKAYSGVGAYDYGRGVHLKYRQIGAGP